MIGVPGGCVVCDNPITDNGRPMPNHTQVTVRWSNGSDMVVGVCVTCASTHAWSTDAGKKMITNWHHTYWDRVGAKYDKAVIIV